MLPNLTLHVALLGGLTFFLTVNADLPTGEKKCGEISCEKGKFCSPSNSQCRPCRDVCELRSNNYQSGLCMEHCQEFIHDQLYWRRDEEPANVLNGTLQHLTTLVSISLVICCLLFAVVICLLVFVFFRLKRINGPFFKTFSKDKQKVAAKNNNADVENPKMLYKGEGLKLDMPAAQPQVPLPPSVSPTQDPVTPATTSTPLSRPRHPSEDTTLEYAYDNPALTPSPVFNKDGAEPMERKESSF